MPRRESKKVDTLVLDVSAAIVVEPSMGMIQGVVLGGQEGGRFMDKLGRLGDDEESWPAFAVSSQPPRWSCFRMGPELELDSFQAPVTSGVAWAYLHPQQQPVPPTFVGLKCGAARPCLMAYPT